ncbi:MAG TPA: hypothetical protein VL946_07070, partial [Lacibacter sp.]|nr:hypothetical protein [Lacibacter sp.]
MKQLKLFLLIACCMSFTACKKIIDLYPQSNINTGTYYANYAEVKAALTGCYNGMQRPLNTEWQFTELRSDNSKMGSPGSTAVNNRDLSDLDIFTPNTAHQALYTYWLATYNNIRNCNIVLQKLGVSYDAASGVLTFNNISIPIS